MILKSNYDNGRFVSAYDCTIMNAHTHGMNIPFEGLCKRNRYYTGH
jgi:hypothetical protein